MRYIFCFFYLLLIDELKSQESQAGDSPGNSSPNSTLQAIQNLVPVDTRTGVANIPVELYNVNNRGTNLNVNLNYNTSGIKVREISSNVGIGWGLNAGGSIVRKVKDNVDDEEFYVTGLIPNQQQRVGWFYTPSQYLGVLYDQVKNDQVDPNVDWEKYDTESDEYYFNINGISGMFYFDENKEIKYNCNVDIKIIPHFETAGKCFELEHPFFYFHPPNSILIPGRLDYFVIIGPDGTEYEFKEKEYNAYRTQTKLYKKENGFLYKLGFNSCSNDFIDGNDRLDDFNWGYEEFYSPDYLYDGAITSWQLSKITNKFGNVTFILNYENEILWNHSVTDHIYTNKLEIENCDCLDDYWHFEILTTVSVSFNKRISSIDIFNNTESNNQPTKQTIKFNYRSQIREDLYYANVYNNHPSNYYRASLLEKIEYKNSNNEIINGYSFNIEKAYSNYMNSYHPREFIRYYLRSINKFGSNLTQLHSAYNFFYHNYRNFPSRNSSHMDIWGLHSKNPGEFVNFCLVPKQYYYPDDVINNRKYQGPYSFFKRNQYQGQEYIADGNLRLSNEEDAKSGLLYQITTPEGTKVVLTYKQNVFDVFNQQKDGCGLRIEKISFHDGIYSNQKEITLEFKYSTGKLYSMPKFGAKAQAGWNYQCGGEVCKKIYFGMPIGDMFNIAGQIIYDECSIETNGIGKTVFKYENKVYFGIESSDCNNGNCIYEQSESRSYGNNSVDCKSFFPFAHNPNYSSNDGFLKEKLVYDVNNQLILKAKYTYAYTLIKKIKEVKKAEGWNSGSGVVHFALYHNITGINHLIEVSEDYYSENGGVLNKIKHFDYITNTRLLSKEYFQNSDGYEYAKEFIYPYNVSNADYPNTSSELTEINKLIDFHRIGELIEVKTSYNNQLIDVAHYSYESFDAGSGNLLKQIGIKYIRQKNTNAYRIIKKFEDFDSDGVPRGIYNLTFDRITNEYQDGLLITSSFAGWTSQYTYNANRLLETTIDHDGQVRSVHYDLIQRISYIEERSGGITTSFSYNDISKYMVKSVMYSDYNTQIEHVYFNGFGQEFKNILINQGPRGQNLIFTKNYDKHGRLGSETYRQGSLTYFTYDDSPLNRLKTAHPPGPGMISYKHETNEESVSNPNGPDYPAHSLIKEVVIDENGNPTSNFTDKLGRLVMVLDAMGGKTYYGYDEYNRISDVIPPGSNKNSAASYSYKYDLYSRIEEKKLPDSEPIYYRYNDKDLMVAFQDGNMRSLGVWLASEYDQHGRVLSSGYGSESGAIASVFIQNEYSHPTLKSKLTQTTANIFGLDPPPPGQQYPSAITTNYVYDDFGRVTSTSANSLKGVYSEEYEYDMADNIKYSKSTNGLSLEQTLIYDHAKRLTRIYHGPKGLPGQLQVKLDYTSDNELLKKGLHGYGPDNNPKFLQTINYGYNERGWLTRINSPVRFEIPVPIPTCGSTLIPPGPNEDCNSALITLSEFLTLRRSLVNFSLECYTECSISELCTSNISIGLSFYFNPDDPNRCPQRDITIIEMRDNKGQVISLNYPYFIDCQIVPCELKNASGNTLKTDLENWLHSNNYEFKEVKVSVDQNGFINISLVDAKQVKISSIKVHCSDGDAIIYSNYDCRIDSDDPELIQYPLHILHSDTCIRDEVLSNIDTSHVDTLINYPVVLYELNFNDGVKMYVLEDEMPPNRGVLRKIRCKTIYSERQKIRTIIDSTETELTLSEFLEIRNQYLYASFGPGNGSPDPDHPDDDGPGPDVPDMDEECICTYNKSIAATNLERCSAFNGVECPSPDCEELHMIYPLNKDKSITTDGVFWNIHKTTNEPILGKVQWRFKTDIDKDAIITKIKAKIDFGPSECPKIQGYSSRIKIILIQKPTIILELIPNKKEEYYYGSNGNEMVELEVKDAWKLKPSDIDYLFLGILSSGCTNINIDGVSMEIDYELKCDGRDLNDACNKNDPKCNDKTNTEQQASLEKLKLKWNTRDISSVNFPARLLRLRLCNGDEIYILDDELQDLLPPYIILQTLIIPDELYLIKFSGGNLPGGPNNGGVGPKVGPGDQIIQELDDLFAERIQYWESGIYKNGNIGNVLWQVKYQTQMGYTYTYDALNRMLDANFSEYGVSYGGSKYNENGITYDQRGNILTLKRNGLSPIICSDAIDLCGNELKQYTAIDDLQYQYELGSNKLISVTDHSDRERGFKQGQQVGNYEYDSNGNITYDPNGDAHIVYNHMNLPSEIITPQGIIKIAYDAFGNRIRVVRNEGTFDYIGPFEYLNGVWENTYFTDGRIHRFGNSSRYEYFIKDHVGNTRVLFSDLNDNKYVDVSICPDPNNELLQVNHFYPFGLNFEMPWIQLNTAEDKYQYNGIERINSAGLDWDFAFYRTLDPSTARWLQSDSKAEELHPISPYSSMINNPIRYVDPEGDLPFIPLAIIAAAGVGGTVNLINQALAGNVTNFSEGVAYFLNGGLSGAISVLPGGGPAYAGLVNSLGNKIIQLGSGKLKPADFDDLSKAPEILIASTLDFIQGAGIGKLAESIFPQVFERYYWAQSVSWASNAVKQTFTYEGKELINWEIAYKSDLVITSTKIPINQAFATSTKLLNQFNSAESFLEGAKGLKQLTNHKFVNGFVEGDIDAIFKAISQGGKLKPSGAIELSNGWQLFKYGSKSKYPSIQVNTGEKIYKIRIK